MPSERQLRYTKVPIGSQRKQYRAPFNKYAERSPVEPARKYYQHQSFLRGIVTVWFLVSVLFLVTKASLDFTDTFEYLTYWSLTAESFVLFIVMGLQIAQQFKSYHTSDVLWRLPVVFGGFLISTSTMVLLGSVYISSAAFVDVGIHISMDPASGISNFIIHTIPFVFSIIYFVAYEEEAELHLSDSYAIVPFKDYMDFLFFWPQAIVPMIWSIWSTSNGDGAEGTYHLPGGASMMTFYLLLGVSIFAPTVFLVVWAKARRNFRGKRRWLLTAQSPPLTQAVEMND